jgi:hypothetical protein
MLKAGRGWGPENARALHEASEVLARALHVAGAIPVAVPTPLGWDERPPLVCTPYIDGVDVFFLLSDLTHPGWNGSLRQPIPVVTACGRALGAYHSSFPADQSDAPATERALPGLEAAARVCGVRRAKVERLADDLVVARSFGDIGPHQFRLEEPGRLYLLDPPVETRFEAVSRDIARFTFEVDKILGQDAGTRRVQRRAGPQLRESFLRGYAETGPADPTTPTGRWLVRLFEGAAAAGTAHKRLAEREYGSALRNSLSWMGALIALRLQPPKPSADRTPPANG